MMSPNQRFSAVVIIWATAGIVTIMQLIFTQADFNWIFSVILFGIAAGMTPVILNDIIQTKKQPSLDAQNDTYADNTTGKRKNDQAGGLSPDMLALLDEDDIEELRRRVKNRLIERIEGGGDGELSSLDALLADQDAPRKARR